MPYKGLKLIILDFIILTTFRGAQTTDLTNVQCSPPPVTLLL
jgi:hypothetical protein